MFITVKEHTGAFNRAMRGFTLVEIMIVVFILGLLVAMAMPNFLRLRLNANEQMIRGDLRSFSTANESYRAVQNPPVYAPDIATLIDEHYLDTTWTNPGNKHGYNFVYNPSGTSLSYSLEASILNPGVTGIHYYCVDATGVVVMGAAEGMGTSAGCVGGEPIGQ
ncbi:MAG TPA: type II secretion system protein [Candidatus Omnitrophota bacterium]|nr:type II secretion system protein [Candidatus Omnitrophota bacterium]HPS37314.1 type II secretion system protein [Candidatus Omnitrophota bacterium]